MSEDASYRVGRAMVSRLAGQPEFLAWAFAVLARQGWGESQIAAKLGVAPNRFVELSLCPKPRAEYFGRDVDDLAHEFNLDGAALSALVRQAEVVAAVSDGPLSAGWLMAAREKADEDDADGEASEGAKRT